MRVVLTKVFNHFILSFKCIFLRSRQAHLGIGVYKIKLAQSVERLNAEREFVGLIPGAGPILRS